jgi:hypothetical protein
MSNTFNTNENKSKILDLIKGSIKENLGTVESAFPDQYIYTEDQKQTYSSTKSATILKEKKVSIYKTRAIPTLEKTSAEEYLPERLWPLLQDDPKAPFHRTVILPIGDREYIPQYRPVYRSSKYDVGLYNQIIYQAITNDNAESYEANKKIIADIDNSTRNYVYCSGTMSGQLTRLAEMTRIRNAVKSNGKQERVSAIQLFDVIHKNMDDDDTSKGFNSLETGCNLFFKYHPIYSVELEEDTWPGLTGKPSKFIDLGGPELDSNGEPLLDNEGAGIMRPEIDYLPAIKNIRSAGEPYEGKQKGEVITEALILADSFMGGLSEALTCKRPDRTAALASLMGDFWWLSCGYFFPKAEIYKRTEISTKTRNIWAMPFPSHLLNGLLYELPKKYSPNVLLDPNLSSLYRFSPFHGGMDRLINLFLNIQEPIGLAYADNIYLIYPVGDDIQYYSFDLTKAEAQVTPEDAVFLNYYFLTRGHSLINGTAAFDSTWAFFATTIQPNLSIDSTVLMSNLQIKLPGQGSGNTATYDNNTLSSAKFLITWELRGKPLPNTKEWTTVIDRCGVDFKLEFSDMNLKTTILNAKRVTRHEGYLGLEGDNKPPEIPPPIVELDLLGWSAVYSPILDSFVPTLQTDRFTRSICLTKKDDNLTDLKEAQQFYKLVRSEALRLIGGIIHKPVDNALKQLASEARISLDRAKVDMGQTDRVFKLTDLSQILDGVEFSTDFTVDQSFLLKLFQPKPTTYTNVLGKPLQLIENAAVKPAQLSTLNILDVKTFGSTRVTLTVQSGVTDLYENIMNERSKGKGLTIQDLYRNPQFTKLREEMVNVTTYLEKRPAITDTRELISKRAKDIESVIDPYNYYKVSQSKYTGSLYEKSGVGPQPTMSSKVLDARFHNLPTHQVPPTKPRTSIQSKPPSKVPPPIKPRSIKSLNKPQVDIDLPEETIEAYKPKATQGAPSYKETAGERRFRASNIEAIQERTDKDPVIRQVELYVADHPYSKSINYMFSAQLMKFNGKKRLQALAEQSQLAYYVRNPAAYETIYKQATAQMGPTIEEFEDDGGYLPTPQDIYELNQKYFT